MMLDFMVCTGFDLLRTYITARSASHWPRRIPTSISFNVSRCEHVMLSSILLPQRPQYSVVVVVVTVLVGAAAAAAAAAAELLL